MPFLTADVRACEKLTKIPQKKVFQILITFFQKTNQKKIRQKGKHDQVYLGC